MTAKSGIGRPFGRRDLLRAATLAPLATLAGCGGTGDKSARVLRIGAPTVIGSTATQTYFGTVGIARTLRLFEREFSKDGIGVEFIGFSNAPMVAQALANDQIDFAGHGDMVSIIARSGGARTKMLLPSNRLHNAYAVVPASSPIRSITDLRGKRVAFAVGNLIHLQVIRILRAQGLDLSDVRVVNLAPAASAAALIAGRIDAAFGNADILRLVQQRQARILFDTRRHYEMSGRSAILVREEFSAQQPELTARAVRVLVEAARYGSDEGRREEVMKIWATGRAIEPLREDMRGETMRNALSPLLDPFIVDNYRRTQKDLQALGMLRGAPFDIAGWIDRSYLDRALKDLGLESYWTPRDESGQPLA